MSGAGAERDEVLAANRAFYAALAGGDYGAMEHLWARRAPVACLHPGWQPLLGRAAVMESWARILANPDPTPIACRGAAAQLHGDVAVVVCHEIVAGRRLAASNVFVRENEAWRLILHQSGPVAAVPGRPAAASPRRLH